jgi:hypothetical protein
VPGFSPCGTSTQTGERGTPQQSSIARRFGIFLLWKPGLGAASNGSGGNPMGKLANTDKHSPVVETAQPNPEQLNQKPPQYPVEKDSLKKQIESEKKIHDKEREEQKKTGTR